MIVLILAFSCPVLTVGAAEELPGPLTVQEKARFASNILTKGESKGKAVKGVDPKEMKRGEKIEKEHTPDKKVARKIALDHVKEHKDYYDDKKGLPAMERKLEKKAMGWGRSLSQLAKIKGAKASTAMGKYVPKSQRVAGGGKRILSGGGMETIVGGKAGESVTRPNLNIRTGVPKMKKVGAFFRAFVDELERKT